MKIKNFSAFILGTILFATTTSFASTMSEGQDCLTSTADAIAAQKRTFKLTTERALRSIDPSRSYAIAGSYDSCVYTLTQPNGPGASTLFKESEKITLSKNTLWSMDNNNSLENKKGISCREYTSGDYPRVGCKIHATAKGESDGKNYHLEIFCDVPKTADAREHFLKHVCLKGEVEERRVDDQTPQPASSGGTRGVASEKKEKLKK